MKSKLKFTTLFPDTVKEKFENIKSSTVIMDSCLVKGNSKWVGLSWASTGGGALAILDSSNPKKLDPQFPMIRGHQGTVLDFDFYPFNEDIVATSSDDTKLRLWQIPSEFKEDLLEPTAVLSGHQKKANLITFNPSAQSIVASSSFDGTIKVWNVENQQCLNTLQANDSFMSCEWNHDGSLIGTSNRDKKLRIGDARAPEWTAEIAGHSGPKTQKFNWLNGTPYIFTTGFNTSYEREFMLWDHRKFDQAVQTSMIDNQSGTLYSHWDGDCNVLYVGGKGDGNIRYYELADGQLHTLNQHTSTTPAKGLGWVPKRCVDTTKNELARCIKLTNTTIEWVTFRALRKSSVFQPDLYPDCISEEPALSADEWVGGKNAEPKRRSMAPDAAPSTGGSTSINVKSGNGNDEEVKKLQSQVTDLTAENDALKKENAELKEKIAQLEAAANKAE